MYAGVSRIYSTVYSLHTVSTGIVARPGRVRCGLFESLLRLNDVHSHTSTMCPNNKRKQNKKISPVPSFTYLGLTVRGRSELHSVHGKRSSSTKSSTNYHVLSLTVYVCGVAVRAGQVKGA